jgi:hypothetical protein
MIQAIEDGYQEGGRKLAEKIWQFGAIILPFEETGVVNFDFPTVWGRFRKRKLLYVKDLKYQVKP